MFNEKKDICGKRSSTDSTPSLKLKQDSAATDAAITTLSQETKYLCFPTLARHSVSVCLLFLQPDGNLAVYGWKSVWTSDTAGIDAYRLCMQNDCNLVMYNKSGQAIWQSNSARGSGKMCRLCLTDEGKLQVYREGELIWTNDKPWSFHGHKCGCDQPLSAGLSFHQTTFIENWK